MKHIRRIVACTVKKSARLIQRCRDASRVELYTDVAGHDCPLVALGPASTDQTAYARGERGGQ